VPTVSCVLSTRFARRVIEELPQVSLCIVESYGGHLVEWLHRGEMDMALMYGPSVDLHLSVDTIGRDDIVAVGPCGSGLAERKEVTIDWLSEQKLVLPSHSHGLRILIEKALSRKNLPIQVLIEADSFRVLTSFVEDGLGFTLLPHSAVRADAEIGRLEVAAIARPGITRELIVAQPADRQPSIATAAISEFIKIEIERLRAEGLWNIRMVGPDHPDALVK
jgi:LysR family nitrogen assimilation transcriptional regulator